MSGVEGEKTGSGFWMPDAGCAGQVWCWSVAEPDDDGLLDCWIDGFMAEAPRRMSEVVAGLWFWVLIGLFVCLVTGS